MPALKIISKKNGFRRCGIAHPDSAVIHPAGTFTEQQIAILKAEPMLIVDEIPDPPAENKAGTEDDLAASQPAAGSRKKSGDK